jgi:hypothetical protein
MFKMLLSVAFIKNKKIPIILDLDAELFEQDYSCQNRIRLKNWTLKLDM